MNVIPFNESALRFTIKAHSGLVYEVDLREFAVGGKVENVPTKSRAAWAGDFNGRPDLALEFAQYFQRERPEPVAIKTLKNTYRGLFRFLDAIESKSGSYVTSISDVTDAHGAMMLEWLGGTTSTYRRAKTLLDALRRAQGLPALFWPARKPDPVSVVEPIEPEAVRQLAIALKHEARSIKRMFDEGERLALKGRDPREGIHLSQSWARPENRAWLIRHLTSDRLLEKNEFKGADAYRGLAQEGFRGPSYLAPNMSERGREGIVGALRWFYPSVQDTAVFLWLFLLQTGWNLSTALGVDISSEENWYQAHPHSPGFAVIHSFKARADRHQFTISMTKPEWRPYRIVRYMIERTEVLRNTLRYRLELARAEYDSDPSDKNSGKIQELKALIRSPWLYHTINKTGEVSGFKSQDASHLGDVARAVADAHGLLERFPTLGKMVTSDARDAWIGHAYVQSGYQVMLAQLAAQHSNLRTLKHYLRSRRYRGFSEEQVRKVQDAAFSEIAANRIVDPSRLRLLVTNGAITAEQEQRLQDLRQRTRVGLGCLDPRNPPSQIAPDHKSGALCRVQRCTGCQHGVVFKESLQPLARASAELIQIQRTIPYSAWKGSSLEDELASIEQTLKSFNQAEVEAALLDWSQKLESGEIRAHDTYPLY